MSLEFKNITKSYQDGQQIKVALKETNFKINPGEFVAIIGPSGSGKSTFLTLAGGLQTPTSGQILIGDVDYTNLNEKQRSAKRFQDIGFILQSSNLIPFLTVEKQFVLVDNINKNSDEARRKKLLEELSISHLANKYPNELSGGERQRVAIARALYNNPVIILADEPTASLDTTRAYEVVELLARESKLHNKAVIMVTHDKRMIEKCDAIYEMKDGVLNKLEKESLT